MWTLKGIKTEKISEETYRIESLRGGDLDNHIFELRQRCDLSKHQLELLHEADVAYLQDKEQYAAEILAVLCNSLNGIELDSIQGPIPIFCMGIDPEDIIF